MVFRRCAGSPAKKMNPDWSLYGSAALSAALLLGTAPADAQSSGQVFVNPPALLERGAARPFLESVSPGAPPVQTGRRDFDLTVAYTDNKIWNPATQRFDKVHLRSYTGEGVNPDAPFVAPAIEVRPGQTVSMTLHNKLPADSTCTAPGGDVNDPHCFNGTNLHSHGLWVSPSGNSDNVLLSINPGVSFEYIYNLPPDHPAGTFWYHSHRHGSTALQVSSGMAGALIVRGDRVPTPTRTGDIDVILKNADLTAMEDRTLVLQQIQYACLDDKGQVKVQLDPADPSSIIAWVCDANDVGVIENYSYPDNVPPPNTAGAPTTVGFGPGSWNQSARFTTINGIVRPVFQSRAGRAERWRLIHGGVRDTITFGFRARKAGAPSYAGLNVKQAASYIQENCTGELLSYQQIAADGLTMANARSVPTSTLQPGYRYDALVVFPTAGDYCVVNESAPPGGSVSRQATTRQLLGVVEVAPGTPVTDSTAYLQELLSSVAIKTLPANVREKVASELRNGLKFTSFIPHPDIADGEVTGTQELVFFIYIPPPNSPPEAKLRFEVGNKSIDPKNFDPAQFKPLPYDPTRIDRALKLGGVDEWTLQSGFVSHPFHIHVNPFQVVSIIDPSGRDVSLPGAVDNAGGQIDPQYPGLKGVWKDTLWVKDLISNPADFPSKLATSMYTIKVRTRYQRYIGEYVLHCHILDHEDQGMMQNVAIQIPDGAGGLAAGHH